ncbi:hypothetical protein [Pararhodobacter zhoushanensis]|uniref:hypothetical protein n=1 Tax=Pararhodobacter zhoushanensis TaxID=2479545 RepID=UPI000F8D1D8F|nr:hypothetical protein [Pararhodobacter zhoushanensis]
MKRIVIAGVAVVSTFAFVPTASADRGGHSGYARCDYGARGCPSRGERGHGRHDERHGGRHADRHDRRDGYYDRDRYDRHDRHARVGGYGHRGQRFEWREGYRFGPAPRGREYQIVNNQVVLVDSETMQILAIVGLLSDILN